MTPDQESYLADLRAKAKQLAFAEYELHELEVEAQEDGDLTFEQTYRAQLEGRREADEAVS